MIQYRMVAGPSFEKLAKKLMEMGEPQPHSLLSVGFIAEDEDGNIVAHCVLQNLPVVEPMHAEAGYGSHLRKLFKMTQEFILQSKAPRVLMHTSHPAMKRMLDKADADPMADEFFQWLRPESAG